MLFEAPVTDSLCMMQGLLFKGKLDRVQSFTAARQAGTWAVAVVAVSLVLWY
jgi:hypothetical protein